MNCSVDDGHYADVAGRQTLSRQRVGKEAPVSSGRRRRVASIYGFQHIRDEFLFLHQRRGPVLSLPMVTISFDQIKSNASHRFGDRGTGISSSHEHRRVTALQFRVRMSQVVVRRLAEADGKQ